MVSASVPGVLDPLFALILWIAVRITTSEDAISKSPLKVGCLSCSMESWVCLKN